MFNVRDIKLIEIWPGTLINLEWSDYKIQRGRFRVAAADHVCTSVFLWREYL
jgi:hypothetical protein